MSDRRNEMHWCVQTCVTRPMVENGHHSRRGVIRVSGCRPRAGLYQERMTHRQHVLEYRIIASKLPCLHRYGRRLCILAHTQGERKDVDRFDVIAVSLCFDVLIERRLSMILERLLVVAVNGMREDIVSL